MDTESVNIELNNLNPLNDEELNFIKLLNTIDNKTFMRLILGSHFIYNNLHVNRTYSHWVRNLNVLVDYEYITDYLKDCLLDFNLYSRDKDNPDSEDPIPTDDETSNNSHWWKFYPPVIF